jgi:predicted nucleic acid-binding protein
VTFWDSSAVIPLLIDQDMSPRVVEWLSADSMMVLWTLTPVEVVSALWRLAREQSLEEDLAHRAEARLGEIVEACQMIIDVEPVKTLASRLLHIHPLRAFDSLQLGAALHWAEGHPQGRTFHTLDRRLALAAQREGFVVPA